MRECQKCRQLFGVNGIGMHERSCFTSLCQFVEMAGHRLIIDRMTGCISMLKSNGQTQRDRPLFGGTFAAKRLLEVMLGRPLIGFPKEVTRHTCDNGTCVNWWHLKAGSQGDNIRDIWDRQRARPAPVTGPCDICGSIATVPWHRAKKVDGRVLCSSECGRKSRARRVSQARRGVHRRSS